MAKKYGIVSGRFQGFHAAHEHMIRCVLADGLIPVIGINDSAPRSEKDPFTFEQRREMIQAVFPEIPDEHFVRYRFSRNGPETDLKPAVLASLKGYEAIAPLDEMVMYYGAKGTDRDNFIYDGKRYEGMSHSRIAIKPIGPLDGREIDMSSIGAENYSASNLRGHFPDYYRTMPPAAARYMASRFGNAAVNNRPLWGYDDPAGKDKEIVDCTLPGTDWRKEIIQGRQVIVDRHDHGKK